MTAYKYIVLMVSSLLAAAYLRANINEFGKAIHNEGCYNVVWHYEHIGEYDKAKEVQVFCEARKAAMRDYMTFMDVL